MQARKAECKRLAEGPTGAAWPEAGCGDCARKYSRLSAFLLAAGFRSAWLGKVYLGPF